MRENPKGLPGRRNPQLVPPSAAVDDLDELLHTLLGWEDAYREARRPTYRVGSRVFVCELDLLMAERATRRRGGTRRASS